MSRKQINLYQEAFRPARVALPAQSLFLGVAAFALGLVALSAWDAWRVAQLRGETDGVVARADAVARQVERAAQAGAQADPAVVAEAAELEARVRALQAAEAAVASGVLGSETGYSAQFRALARARVPGAWLTGVEIANQGANQGAGRGLEMNLRGRALDGEAPARLIAGLRREPLFHGLTYAALTVRPPAAPGQGGAQTGTPGTPAEAKDATPPRFLEFSLDARLPEAASPPAGAQP